MLNHIMYILVCQFQFCEQVWTADFHGGVGLHRLKNFGVGGGFLLLSESQITQMTQISRIEEAVLLPLSALESASGLRENESFDF